MNLLFPVYLILFEDHATYGIENSGSPSALKKGKKPPKKKQGNKVSKSGTTKKKKDNSVKKKPVSKRKIIPVKRKNKTKMNGPETISKFKDKNLNVSIDTHISSPQTRNLTLPVLRSNFFYEPFSF